MSTGGWLDSSNISNKLKQTYVAGFLDICGNLIVRNGNMIGLYDLSLNGNANIGLNANVRQKLFVGGDISGNGNILLYGNLSVNSNITTNGNISLNGNYLYTQTSTTAYDYIQQFNNTLTISDAAHVKFSVGGTNYVDISSSGLILTNGNVWLLGRSIYTTGTNPTNNYSFIKGNVTAGLTISDSSAINFNINTTNYAVITPSGLYMNSNSIYTTPYPSAYSYIQGSGSNLSISDSNAVRLMVNGLIYALITNTGLKMNNGNITMNTGDIILNNNYLYTSTTGSPLSYIVSTAGTGITTICDTSAIYFDISGTPYAIVNVNGLNFLKGKFILNSNFLYTASVTDTNSYIKNNASGTTTWSDTTALKLAISGTSYANITSTGLTMDNGHIFLKNATLYTNGTSVTNSFIDSDGATSIVSDISAIQFNINGTAKYIMNAGGLALNSNYLYTGTMSGPSFIVSNTGVTTIRDTTNISLNISGTNYANITSAGLTIVNGNMYLNGKFLYTAASSSTTSYIQSNSGTTTINDTVELKLSISAVPYAVMNNGGIYMQNNADITLNNNHLYTGTGGPTTTSYIKSNGSTLTLSETSLINLTINNTVKGFMDANGFTMNGNIYMNNNYIYTSSDILSYIKSVNGATTICDSINIYLSIGAITYAKVTAAGLTIVNGNMYLNGKNLYTAASSSTNSYICSNSGTTTINDTGDIRLSINDLPYAIMNNSGIYMQNSADITLNNNFLYTGTGGPTTTSYIKSNGSTLTISETSLINLTINTSPKASIDANGLTMTGNIYMKANQIFTSSDFLSYIQHTTTDYTTIRDLTKINLKINNTNVVAVDSTSVTIAGSVTATSYNAISDRRLKTNIRTLDNQWQNIKRVIPSLYEWKSSNRSDYGFVAQQLHEVYPNLRKDFSETIDPASTIDEPVDLCGNPLYYTVDYGKMIPYLWKGVQEIMEVVETQNVKLREQSLEIESLKAQLANIHKVLGIS